MVDLGALAPHLREIEPGVFAACEHASVSFPSGGHDGCLTLEARSFWFAHRNEVLLDALIRFPPAGFLLDVGGGNGFVSQALQDAGYEAVLLEPGAQGVANARARGLCPVIHGTLESAGLLPAVVPAVGLFDVLEHIEDDHAFLTRVWHTLRPGGRLYLSVPAYGWLWSHADTQAGHFRRYTTRTLGSLLAAAHFEIEYHTYFFAFVLAPLFLLRALPDRFRPPARDRQRQAEREHRPNHAARWTIDRVCHAERSWMRAGHRLPCGSSLLVVGRKPSR